MKHVFSRAQITVLLASFAMMLSLFFLYWQLRYNMPADENLIITYIKENIYWPFLYNFKKTLFNPIFMGCVIAILFLERLFPAKPHQKIISVSLFQDFMWLLVDGVTKMAILVFYVAWLKSLYQDHLSFLTIKAMGDLPQWLRIMWGIVIADFLFYAHHFIRHKVPWFWHFHVIHHSQKNLNMFSDQRYHFIEYVIENSIYIFPLLMLTVDTPSIALFELVRQWHSRLYHSNLKTNYGPLRYILVTPQSHRIHHSIEHKHRDKNFGVLLSVWDQLFGTQYRGWNEYPDTGIEDPLFPNDSTRNGIRIITHMFAQLIYPFRKIARSIYIFLQG
jgi:sterol desaturase/sphingolipid hydroxylase (fatty acid hydroxylase superfamily)